MSLDDVKENFLDAFEDHRGEIYTVYDEFKSNIKFNHDKICIRYKDSLVGIHGDNYTDKLVTCVYGRVLSVIVDNRPDSVDYLKHKKFILSSSKRNQLFIPKGVGNSFLVLSDFCVYNYKLAYSGEYIDSKDQFTLKWNDEQLKISWPILNPILSDRDK